MCLVWQLPAIVAESTPPAGFGHKEAVDQLQSPIGICGDGRVSPDSVRFSIDDQVLIRSIGGRTAKQREAQQ